jgi:cytochrome c-type biogenesis protein CcsB
MRKVFNFLISSKFTAILLIIFAAAMGTSTFIEDKYDTVTAKMMVYNAKWFELIILLLAVNFIGHIKRYKMLSRGKIGGLLFHLSFVIIILGAGITRYFGYEGMMHLRNGQTSNAIYTSEPYLMIKATDGKQNYAKDFHLVLSEFLNNSFHGYLDAGEKGEIKISYVDYLKDAEDSVVENVENGVNIIELTAFDKNERQRILIKEGEISNIGNTILSYNYKQRPNAVMFSENNGNLQITSPDLMLVGTMQGGKADTIRKNNSIELKENFVYRTMGNIFVFSKLYKKAKTKPVHTASGPGSSDIVVLNLKIGDKNHEISVSGGSGNMGFTHDYSFDGLDFKISYGDKAVELPFSITCRNFILDRYPGTNSPSSFASEVTLVDTKNNVTRDFRIFMNHVLDYEGYRFFQSSYDRDEKGTILSVNHDFYGTWTTYIGYLLLSVAFVFTLVSKKSQFRALIQKNKIIRDKRKAATIASVLFIFLSTSAFSQTSQQKAIDADQADKFGHLTVQTFEGRFAPVHTLAVDVMHKISRKDNFDVEGKGKLTDMQVFLDMILDPDFWKQQRIIYIREKSVLDLLGIEGSNASFQDFFDKNDKYKLQEVAEKASGKQLSEQNTFDKEVIKVDERVNICMMVFKGDFLKIFPPENSETDPWIGLSDSLAYKPLTGNIKIINDNLQLPVLNYNNIIRLYFTEVLKSIQSGDYKRPTEILGYMETIQRGSSYADIIPSNSKTDFEILYNKSNVFTMLRNIYSFLAMFLLIFAFIDNLRTRKSKFVTWSLNFFIVLLALAFVYHTLGMAVRWYLSGHAPWSNGYEALILVSWGAVLAGFSFIRQSKITLAASALLAFFMLMTAGHSSYDPQLTNLQPVLKSYWLILHVAILTVSYSFLGSGFFLGIINLVINLFKNSINKERLNLVIRELTGINEMNLSVGIGLATVGTFLGGVWANESWGRYWGWDAKETWALVIVIAYSVVLHLRLIPKWKGTYIFNVVSVVAFGSVLMTFIGVNYYLSKGMHSYGAGDTPVFPVWAWIVILSVIALIVVAGIKEMRLKTDDKADVTNENN